MSLITKATQYFSTSCRNLFMCELVLLHKKEQNGTYYDDTGKKEKASHRCNYNYSYDFMFGLFLLYVCDVDLDTYKKKN